nr:MAG TPA: hypothetical protein [Caudoviricetes sp.]
MLRLYKLYRRGLFRPEPIQWFSVCRPFPCLDLGSIYHH